MPSAKFTPPPEYDRYAYRLKEANLSVYRFMMVDKTKHPFEKGWQLGPHGPEDFPIYPRWGISGRENLVCIDTDDEAMSVIVRSKIPTTFETRSPRHQLPHFLLKVVGKVPNRTLYHPGAKKGSGEVRADNEILVMAGTEIEYKDLVSGQLVKGRYIIVNDVPIAEMTYEDFMAKFSPYFRGEDNEAQRLLPEEIKEGVEAGERHAKGIRFACKLIEDCGLDDGQALAAMIVWNKNNRPPMEEKDLIRQIRNARGYNDVKEAKIEESVKALVDAKLIDPPTPQTEMQKQGYTVKANKRGGGFGLFKDGKIIDEISGKEQERKDLARKYKIEYAELKQALLEAKNPDETNHTLPMGEPQQEAEIIESPGGANYEQIEGGKYVRYNATTDSIELVDAVDLGETIQIPMKKTIWPLASEATNYENFNQLFAEIFAFVYDHVDYGEEYAPYAVHAAYILATYVIELWKSVPYRRLDGTINVGKTRSMETSHALAFRHLMSSNISEAAIFRICDRYRPSLALDEMGRYVKDKNSTVLDLLNSGYRRGMPAIRMEKSGDKMEVGIFDTFAFKEYAGTDELTPAINSRSIIYQMKQKTRDLNPLIDEATAKQLRNRLLYWRFTMLQTYLNGGNGGYGVDGALTEAMNLLQKENFDSRQIELYTPLLIIAPEGEPTKQIIDFMRGEEEQKNLDEKESFEAKVIAALKNLHDKVAEITTTQYITTNDLYDLTDAVTSKTEVSVTVKRFGFKKVKTPEGLAAFRPNYQLLKSLITRYCDAEGGSNAYDGAGLPKLSPLIEPPEPQTPSVPSVTSVTSVKDTVDTMAHDVPSPPEPDKGVPTETPLEEVAPEPLTATPLAERPPLDAEDQKIAVIFSECRGTASMDYVASKLRFTEEQTQFRLRMLMKAGWVKFDTVCAVWRWTP